MNVWPAGDNARRVNKAFEVFHLMENRWWSVYARKNNAGVKRSLAFSANLFLTLKKAFFSPLFQAFRFFVMFVHSPGLFPCEFCTLRGALRLQIFDRDPSFASGLPGCRNSYLNDVRGGISFYASIKCEFPVVLWVVIVCGSRLMLLHNARIEENVIRMQCWWRVSLWSAFVVN